MLVIIPYQISSHRQKQGVLGKRVNVPFYKKLNFTIGNINFYPRKSISQMKFPVFKLQHAPELQKVSTSLLPLSEHTLFNRLWKYMRIHIIKKKKLFRSWNSMQNWNQYWKGRCGWRELINNIKSWTFLL